MKKQSRFTMLLFTLVLLFALAVPVSASAASSKTKAIKAYNKFLSKSKMKITFEAGGSSLYRTSKMKFALIYLDNDSVPELVINNQPNMQGGFGLAGHAVFTYKNGKVKQVFCIHTTWQIRNYYRKKSVIGLTPALSDSDSSCFYTYLKGTKRKDIASRDGKEYYKLSGVKDQKRITKAKFNSLMKKYVGSTKATTIKYYKNTAANRKKYLK